MADVRGALLFVFVLGALVVFGAASATGYLNNHTRVELKWEP